MHAVRGTTASNRRCTQGLDEVEESASLVQVEPTENKDLLCASQEVRSRRRAHRAPEVIEIPHFDNMV